MAASSAWDELKVMCYRDGEPRQEAGPPFAKSRECPVGKSYLGHLSTESVLFCGGSDVARGRGWPMATMAGAAVGSGTGIVPLSLSPFFFRKKKLIWS